MMAQCYILSHMVNVPLVTKIFGRFYHILAWWPSWSCDPDTRNNSFSPDPLVLNMLLGFINKDFLEMFQNNGYIPGRVRQFHAVYIHNTFVTLAICCNLFPIKSFSLSKQSSDQIRNCHRLLVRKKNFRVT